MYFLFSSRAREDPYEKQLKKALEMSMAEQTKNDTVKKKKAWLFFVVKRETD